MKEKINFPLKERSNKPTYISSKRNKKIGLYWLLTPIISSIVILLLFALANTILSNSVRIAPLALNIINFVLGLLGLINVIAVPFGIVMGIIYLRKKELAKGVKWDERSGKGDNSVIPPEIQKWNWGAAGLTWIWGVYHNVWISLLAFIPFVGIVMIIVLGMKGSELAWRKNKWGNVESFVASQNKWKPWGIGFFVLNLFLFIPAIW